MITKEKHRILIVPDFGTRAEIGMMPALKEAIEGKGGARVIVADLRKMVLDEHPGEELQEAKVIELAARKLESLAADRSLNWGPETYNDDAVDPLLEYALANGIESIEDSPAEKPANEAPLPRTVRHTFSNGRSLTIHVSRSSNDVTGAPHSIVVFGRSAMLADGIGKTDVLFIDPVYDSEWPWKKQYYAGRKAAEQYDDDRYLPYERIETAYSFGTVGYGRFPQPSRYGIFTTDEAARNDWDFNERYERLWMVNPDIHDNLSAMSDLICSFDARELDIPLLDIDRLILELPPHQLFREPEFCRFVEPVHLANVTAIAVGLKRRTPAGKGLSGLRVMIEGSEDTIPIEAFTHYSNLAAIHEAMLRAHEAAKEQEKNVKRIMIVPDYFTPHDSPAVLELHRELQEKGYHVTVFCTGNTLEKSRQGLERICKRRRYDLILTIGTGCLLAARLSGRHRVYVNPDWTAWEWMELHLGEEKLLLEHRGDHEGPVFSYRIDRDEIDMARDMGQRYNIKKGDGLSLGWFTEDTVETGEDSRLAQEHMKRFNSCFYIPHLRLDTDEGIRILANETDKILKTYED